MPNDIYRMRDSLNSWRVPRLHISRFPAPVAAAHSRLLKSFLVATIVKFTATQRETRWRWAGLHLAIQTEYLRFTRLSMSVYILDEEHSACAPPTVGHLQEQLGYSEYGDCRRTRGLWLTPVPSLLVHKGQSLDIRKRTLLKWYSSFINIYHFYINYLAAPYSCFNIKQISLVNSIFSSIILVMQLINSVYYF